MVHPVPPTGGLIVFLILYITYHFFIYPKLPPIHLIYLQSILLSPTRSHSFKMNLPEDQLTPQDILLLRSLLGRFGGQASHHAAPSTPVPPIISATQLPPTPNNGIQPLPTQATQPTLPPVPIQNGMVLPQHSAHPGPSHPSVTVTGLTAVAPTIVPYHSALSGAQGHPPRSTRITNTVENIGSTITGLVNQQRLAAAAVNIPSQVSLPQRTTRRRRRGPAISPPTLQPTFSINSVSTGNESSSQLYRIKVKVYPPQASTTISQ